MEQGHLSTGPSRLLWWPDRRDAVGRGPTQMIVCRFVPAVGLLSMSLLSCGYLGFGTSPGPPYDFSKLEPVVEPIRTLPDFEVVDRQQRGTNCHGQGCARPLLSYYLRPKTPTGCSSIQAVVSSFQRVSTSFTPTTPGHCAYAGEVQGHAVTVAGRLEGGDVLRQDGGTAAVIEVGVFADRLGFAPKPSPAP